jgi:hypothetical protein
MDDAEARKAKNIEAFKELLTPEEWDEVKDAAYTERLAERKTQEAAIAFETLETLRKLRYSVGRLYGHFNNVMAKWSIPALNTFNKAAVAIAIQSCNTDDLEEDAATVETPEKKAPEVVPPVEPPPVAAKTRKRNITARKAAPSAEVAMRRELLEKQLKLRPSTFDEILSRLKADGFPVGTPYYTERVGSDNRVRLVTLLKGDLHSLMRNKIVRQDADKRYRWIAEGLKNIGDRYRYSKKN